MRYYIYEIKFINNEDKPCAVSTPGSCNESDFNASLTEIKSIVFEQATALNGGQEVTAYSESVTDIPQVDYNEIANLTE